MDKEIKFRCYIDGVWFVGNHKHLNDKMYCWDDEVLRDDLLRHLGNKDNQLKFMQYTGIKDIKEKECYEGDIIAIDYADNGAGSCFIAEVFYNEIDAAFYIKNKSFVNSIYEPIMEVNDFTIIGNIYENHELISEV